MEKEKRFYSFLSLLLVMEGGLVNDPVDRGGLTNLGVTQATYTDWLIKNKKKNKSVKDIKRFEVEDIYYENYYSRIPFVEDEYPHFLLFDLAVNSGVGRARQCMREVNNPHNAEEILQWRRKFYRSIVENNPSQERFIKGWMNRLKKIKKNYGDSSV